MSTASTASASAKPAKEQQVPPTSKSGKCYYRRYLRIESASTIRKSKKKRLGKRQREVIRKRKAWAEERERKEGEKNETEDSNGQ